MAESSAHTKWLCKYHIVFTPKYRRKIIYNQMRADIQQIILDLCKWKGVEIIEGHMMPDHIHLLLSIPPKYSVSSFMGYLKGKSAMMIFDRHSNLKYKFGNRRFWATGYYVSAVELNEATIAKYIRKQEKQDQIEDELYTKEYEDPFKGVAKESVHNSLNKVKASVIQALAVLSTKKGFVPENLSKDTENFPLASLVPQPVKGKLSFYRSASYHPKVLVCCPPRSP